MARLTPTVHEGMLTTYLLDGTEQTMELDDERWQRWLRECAECSFRFTSPFGTFAVRRDNSKYWHADCRHEGRNHKRYLGKTEAVTISALYRIAETVYEDIHGQPPSAPLLALTHEELTAYQQHAARVVNASPVPEPLPVSPEPSPSHTPDPCFDTHKERKPLTPREQQVLAALALLKTNEQIALLLGISLDTLKRHLTHLYQKLAFTRRTQLVAHAKGFFEGMMVEDEGERRGCTGLMYHALVPTCNVNMG